MIVAEPLCLSRVKCTYSKDFVAWSDYEQKATLREIMADTKPFRINSAFAKCLVFNDACVSRHFWNLILRHGVDVLSGFAIDFGNGRGSQSVSIEDWPERWRVHLTREDQSGSSQSRNRSRGSQKISSVPEVQESFAPL